MHSTSSSVPEGVAPFGVYVHVPFCASRCDYCAFATWTDRHHLQDDYLAAMAAEIDRAALGPVTSVFVGGGTPTAVDPEGLMRVLAHIPLVPGAEVTVECNPDDVTPSLMEAYVAGGVNRVSMGVQSMVPHVLASLGRRHRPENVRSAVAAARTAGLERINLDLIYGGAGESLDDWRTTIEAVLALEPPHVSAYALTVEAGTPLALEPERHPDDDDLADKYELADELFEVSGRPHYEVSNWAAPGFECQHNLLYWRQGDYLGIGCAAHSHRSGRRWWNLRTPERYIAAVAAGESTEASHEDLDADTRRVEGLQLRLRTTEGIPVDAIAPEDRVDLEGLVVQEGDRLVLTRAGRLLANEVAIRVR